MADEVTNADDVEGYAGRMSYRPGEQLTLHVSCETEAFDVEIHRWGARREPVWRQSSVTGTHQPTPLDADANGCRWSPTIELEVPPAWTSGFYHVSLTAVGAPPERAHADACFVVRSAAPAAPVLLVLATNTYQAYNSWGGRSLYTGGAQVSLRRPLGRGLIDRRPTERDDRKARPRRFREEPDPQGSIYERYRNEHGYPAFIGSTGWYTYERRFVEWAEGAGFRLDYAISTDLADDPRATDGYALVLGVGHDEYWSAAQRDAVEAHVAAGGAYASLSGNTMFWQVRITDDGAAMVCHKYAAHRTDPVVAAGDRQAMSGMWCDPLVGRPESRFLGAGSAYGLYHRFGAAVARGSGAFTVYRDRHWLLAGTGLRYGDVLGQDDGVVGYETVGCPLTLDSDQLPVALPDAAVPADVEIVAYAPSSNLAVGEYSLSPMSG